MKMKSKTCGECKHYIAEMFHCQKNDVMAEGFNTCEDFEPEVITNGDKIRQGGNDALIDFADGIRRRMCHYCTFAKNKSCVDKTGDCWEGVRAWLNAQALITLRDENRSLKAEITRYRRALYNLKEDCTQKKHFAVSDEEKLF